VPDFLAEKTLARYDGFRQWVKTRAWGLINGRAMARRTWIFMDYKDKELS
jgi:hypothetical protein